MRKFYLNDQLGTPRVVIDQNGDIISAEDLDMWGYRMADRSFQSDTTFYKYTGKERDVTTGYDYFGARYYDSRIGRWGQVEPLMEKYVNISPYIYSVNNPIVFLDQDGKDPYRKYLGSMEQVIKTIEQNPGKSYWEYSEIFAQSDSRFIYTEEGGFIDLRHFFAAASVSSDLGRDMALIIMETVEFQQRVTGNKSADNPEDRPSNLQGAEFGVLFKDNKELSTNFKKFISSLKPLDPFDLKIAPGKIYIPFDEHDIPVPRSMTFDPYHGESPNYGKRNIPK